MKILSTDLKKSEEIALKHGFKIAPKDHPIYSEGSTIFFVQNSRPKKQIIKCKKEIIDKKTNNGEQDG
jgi:hypothetical protein